MLSGLLAPIKRFAAAYGSKNVGNYASALAFNMLISAFPLILGLLGILGFVLHDPARSAAAESQLLGFFPGDSRAVIQNSLDGIKLHSGLFGIIGLLGFIWSGSNLFCSMELPFDAMYGVKQRNFFRQRAMSGIMTVVFLVALLAGIGFNALLNLIPGSAVISPLVGFGVWTLFALMLYVVIPNRKIKLRTTFVGAVSAGVLLEAITLAWPLYFHLSHGFNTYGATFALFFLMAAWFYFLSQIVLIGLVLNALLSGEPAATQPEREVVATSSRSKSPEAARR